MILGMDRRKSYLTSKLEQLEEETDLAIKLARLFFEDTKTLFIDKALALKDSKEFLEQYPSLNSRLSKRLDHLANFNSLTETLLGSNGTYPPVASGAEPAGREQSHASSSIQLDSYHDQQLAPVASTNSHAGFEANPSPLQIETPASTNAENQPVLELQAADQLVYQVEDFVEFDDGLEEYLSEDQVEEADPPAISKQQIVNCADDVKWMTLTNVDIGKKLPVSSGNQERDTSKTDCCNTSFASTSSQEDRPTPLLQSSLPSTNKRTEPVFSFTAADGGESSRWSANYDFLLEQRTAESDPVQNTTAQVPFLRFTENPGVVDREWYGMVELINTPSEFYMHIGSLENLVMDDFHNKIQAYYCASTNIIKPKHIAQIKLGNFCACYCPDGGGGWYRGQILDWCLDKDEVIVQLVDHGHKIKATLDMLRPLHEDFKNQPLFAIRCELAFVKPPAQLLKWPQASTNMFKEEVSKFKTFTIIPIDIENASTTTFNLNHSKSVSVVVVPKTDGAYDESMNDFLVGCGYADYTELPPIIETNDLALNQSQTSSSTGEIEAQNSALASDMNDDLVDWDPMQEAHEDPYDDENACIAVSGYDPQDESRVCPIFAKTGHCYKGNSCRKEHSLLDPYGYTTDKEMVHVRAYNTLSTPEKATFMNIEVTFVLDTKFYAIDSPTVTSEHDGETLSTLVSALNSPNNVRNLKRLSICPAIGQIVVAQFATDRKWYRGRAINTLDAQGMIDVLFVDYGNVAAVPQKFVRDIEPKFLHLPFQARLFSLANVAFFEETRAKATEFLHNIVANKVLTARVLSYCPITSIIQCLLSDDCGTDIGVILARKGYASLIVPTDYIQLCANQTYFPG